MRQVLTAAALWLAGSTLLAIVLTAQEGLHFLWAFRTSGWQCAILVALAYVVWRLLPTLERLPVVARILAHSLIAGIVVVLWELAFGALLGVLAGTEVAELRREVSGYWRWLQASMMYGVVLAGMIVVRTNRRLRAEERKAGELRLLMRESELRALRAQLRPHFLFNALNSIYALIPDRPQQASNMVALLSSLMRETMELTDRNLVTLDEELDLVARYLEIEGVRFGERLTASVEADEETRQALVPPLLLQPLVENAVHHGVAPRVEPGVVRVRAERINADAGEGGPLRVRLQITDNGAGFDQTGFLQVLEEGSMVDRDGHGHGLRITHSRLKNHYGDDFSFQVNSRDGCTSVEVELPFHSEHL